MSVLPSKKKIFVSELIRWGSVNRRDFPWRRTTNPFHVLVAEVMLQRTNARQVEPAYHRFIDQYPSPKDLAEARLEDVAKDLQPLGLAYRASRLKQMANIIVAKLGGEVPSREEELLQLPGVGKYVASAVRCFAFEKDVPIVDANVLRVMKRVFSIKTPKESHKKPEMWNLMAAMIPKKKAREFNLSILDFAGLICTSRNPVHETCPLRDICDFYARINMHKRSRKSP